MTKKQKIILAISVAELFIIATLVIIFNLPFTKAVTFKAQGLDSGGIVAVNTKGRTNFSEQINSEIDDFINNWIAENMSTEKEEDNVFYSPVSSVNVLSDTSNLCVVQIKITVYEKDRGNPVNGVYVKKALGEEVFDYYIYVDPKTNTLITQKVIITDTFTEND